VLSYLIVKRDTTPGNAAAYFSSGNNHAKAFFLTGDAAITGFVRTMICRCDDHLLSMLKNR